MSTTPAWVWELTDPHVSGSSGDISKLFRNESVEQPGVLAQGAPSSSATLLTREVIQNSWDSARELARDLTAAGIPNPGFQIGFDFADLSGGARSGLIDNLGLGSLATRAVPELRRDLGLGEADCLTDLDAGATLRTLQIHERAATGMYGPFLGARSRLYLALISVGYTQKQSGAGGSYGYGKAGLIRASATRTVVAYTCFRERDDDPGVTRRLLGMTYWGQHEYDNRSFTGFARFGERTTDGYVDPFENDSADEIATRLGIRLRSSTNVEDLGTTFLIIDPTVTPDDVRVSIERNWWPALVDGEFSATVTTPDGEALQPRPRKDKVLRTFIRAYELATTPQDNSSTEERRVSMPKVNAGGARVPSGALGLVAKMDDWSFANELVGYSTETDDESGQVQHSSLVALIRGPRMVVEYYDPGGGAPFVRGAFIADPAVDDLLRQTEPKAHDSWQTRIGDGDGEKGINSEAPRVAKRVLENIRREVREFRKRLKPPVPKAEDIRLPLLRDLFKDLMDGPGQGRKKPLAPDLRSVSIHVDQHVEKAPDDPTRIRLRASVSFSLSPHVDESHRQVRLTITYKFVEDGRSGEICPIDVTAPSGFDQSNVTVKKMVKGETVEVNEGPQTQFVGTLTSTPVTFTVVSIPYAADWSAQLVASGDLIDLAGGSQTEGEVE